jgi:uncharacterized GH25 family protein
MSKANLISPSYPMRIHLTVCVSIALLLASTSSYAHDYWLEPESFFPDEGKLISISLFMGEALKVEAERPLAKSKIERFTFFSSDSQRDLLSSGIDEQVPVARTIFPKGHHLLAMERKPQTIKIEADKFTRYLEDEGLTSIVARRKALGESKVEGKERYIRYLKAFVRCGEAGDSTFGRVVGHRLEILPQSNPASGAIGDPLVVKILFEAKPLSGTRVFAEVRDEAGKVHSQSASTDAEGKVSFNRSRAGMWLIRLVHMVRAPEDDEMDWV